MRHNAFECHVQTSRGTPPNATPALPSSPRPSLHDDKGGLDVHASTTCVTASSVLQSRRQYFGRAA